MTVEMSADLGILHRFDAVGRVIGSLEGKTVIDIGCGEGAVAKALAKQGAVVTGYDPFIKPTERTELGAGSYALLNATADAIPEADGSADLVIFMFSLHHVPQALHAAAMAEARRILKPGGRLFVAEPLAEGPAQYVSELFHDETVVRADALQALKSYAAPTFGGEEVLYFHEGRSFPDFDAYLAQQISNMRFNDYTEAQLMNPEVKRRFDEMFAIHGGKFDQRVRINLFAA